ncbi:MAG TPA: NADP-dependent isocitrate dehydrogenase [Nitriliruptorales bacterium]
MKIRYTYTDEAPALATHSFLPILESFTQAAGVEVELLDISLAARILAKFPDRLTPDQRVPDALAELAELVKQPDANIIKLPNISASLPQLEKAIQELQDAGYDIPDYPEEPSTDEERDARARYDQVKGSAVNPVLREGNSDRRAPKPVKQYARRHPHPMGQWSADSRTRVATMAGGDFGATEQSVTVPQATDVRVEFVAASGRTTVLGERVALDAGEVIDGSVMRKAALVEFLKDAIEQAQRDGVLWSLHLKATMMKVQDPIVFGHAVQAYFRDTWAEHGDTFAQIGVNPNDGLAALLDDIRQLPDEQRQQIVDALDAERGRRADLSMVNSSRGITNLHVPSDVIVDASMPAMIRNGGQLWDADGNTRDTLATIPDSNYAGLYQVVIDDCRAHGAYDPTTMGTVSNVGLMAMKAEEYGSHDKTFEVAEAGTVRVVDNDGEVLMEHAVEAGDVWRGCTTKDAAIEDWVKLAVNRARATGWPAVFWLDERRAHDAQLIGKVQRYLGDHDTEGLDLPIMSVQDATQLCVDRIRKGENTVSVTGNVLRDYITDLFPILEVGTSAKMLSIVPLMNGGGLFETGAGGSAPKHVQQLLEDNHLRWDSLGEYLALTVSLEHLSQQDDNPRARILGQALDTAVERYLEEGHSPSRKVNEPDNRHSAFYVGMFWAQALADQDQDAELASAFEHLARELADHQEQIHEELLAVQGHRVDLDGYYFWDGDKATQVMRPSAALNRILEQFSL